MNTHLKTTKEVIELLQCSKATFFAHQSKLDIKPHKKGNKNYYDQEQIKAFENHINTVQVQSEQSPDSEQSSLDTKQAKPDHTETITPDSDELKTHLKQEVDRLQAELKEAREQAQEKIQTLSGQVGHWQGRASVYQEQYQKLLQEKEPENLKNSSEKKKSEDGGDIIEAEIIAEESKTKNPEKNPTKISEEKPEAEKKGWFARFFSPL